MLRKSRVVLSVRVSWGAYMDEANDRSCRAGVKNAGRNAASAFAKQQRHNHSFRT
jgi:hypothetical protein